MLDRRLQIWARVFALGSLVHVTLPDFQQAGWGPPGVLEAMAAVWLLWRPNRLAFALSAISTLWPLLFLRDVLTQSAWLTLVAVVAAGGRPGRGRAVLDAVRLITAATYALAALHKLNTEFFDPQFSCANHAWDQVIARTPIVGAMPLPPDLLPIGAVALELAVALAVWRGSRWMWPLGVLFHLPLTVTLAPAFAAVMAIGYAAAVSPRDAVRLRRIMRRASPRIVAVGLAAGALDVILVGGVPDVAALLKVIAAGSLGAWTLPLLWAPRRRGWRPIGGRLPALALAVWVAHGFTPYIGWQYQHAAAMLSNLRIDDGCHNSLVMPGWLPAGDPYVRIDAASFADGARPARAERVEATLWNRAALYTMRRNWCVDHLRPIRFEGTYRGASFVLEDLCADDWLDEVPQLESLLPGFQRFQKNLERACPAACVH